MEGIFTSEALVSLLTVTLMEIVLGIDNVVFIAIISGKLPESQRIKARNIGLVLALVPRVILLLFISWLMGLDGILIDFEVLDNHIQISEKGMVLMAGGLFLLYKGTSEIHEKMEGEGSLEAPTKKKSLSFTNAIVQIVLLNIVFSFDSILTAVGLANEVWIMITAVIIALLITLLFVSKISSFVERHPTVKVLALSFLLLIGFLLVAESIIWNEHEVHVPKGYIYFSMAFALFVEIINLRVRTKPEPEEVHTQDK
ncbi:MAG: TerC family protein [Bacteroidia bacterium]|nr:TerC family protein [Bacteroidia bacterium]